MQICYCFFYCVFCVQIIATLVPWTTPHSERKPTHEQTTSVERPSERITAQSRYASTPQIARTPTRRGYGGLRRYVAPYSLRNDSASRPALTASGCAARCCLLAAQLCAAAAASMSALLGSVTVLESTTWMGWWTGG